MTPAVADDLDFALEMFPEEQAFLRERMQKPQRHRLLHGYPLAAAMHRRTGDCYADLRFDPAAGRRLLVGVLPHPFCNPAVAGCGFCTFPHEAFNAARSAAVVQHVIQEITQRLQHDPGLQRRPVAGLYFGGGTANLTPPASFRQLCQALHAAFDFSSAEVTLEGVPAYFTRRPELLDILREELPARHYRLSMGVQTFDEHRLRQMGRQAFGTPVTFHEVVELGHRHGCTVSADLLFNLPHQTLEQMEADLEQALDIGLDHLGLYHLVMFKGLGTAWAQQPEMLAGLPSNEEACERWRSLHGVLLANGFYQTTLTNFERWDLRNRDRRFQYEESSFQPDRFEMLGFGPSAISSFASPAFTTGLKTLNPTKAEDYMAAVRSRATPWDHFFRYQARDLRVFYLTRRLAALGIDLAAYRQLFGSDAMLDFLPELMALEDEGLLEATATAIRPTPRGMFYADAVASLLAWRQIMKMRLKAPVRQRDEPEEDIHSNERRFM